MTVEIKEHERLDDLQNGYYIIQNKENFCFGMDAVLLADFAKVKPGESVLDMCTGNGIVPILLAAKCQKDTTTGCEGAKCEAMSGEAAKHNVVGSRNTKGKLTGNKFVGLEIQEESAEMAGRSVAYNHLEDKVSIVTGDIKEASAIFGKASFSVVTCNPPYMTGLHGLTNANMPKTIARHEVLCTLEDVIAQAAKVLEPRGRFYMVHRPFRLAEIMSLMVRYKLEPKRMRLVHPYVDKEPNMVLIEGLSGGNSRITVEKPLIVYDSPGVYTQELLDIYGVESKK